MRMVPEAGLGERQPSGQPRGGGVGLVRADRRGNAPLREAASLRPGSQREGRAAGCGAGREPVRRAVHMVLVAQH